MAMMMELVALIMRAGKENDKDKLEETDGPDIPYIYIETEDDVQSAIDEIKVSIEERPLIAIDCEGVDLSRKGKLTIVSIATREKVYIFDVLKLKFQIFDNGLRSILENKNIHKLMFDCREDADILHHLFHVKLDGILDVQLLEIMKREQESGSSQTRRNASHDEVVYLKGLLRCLEEYIKHQNIVSKKKKGAIEMDLDKEVWEKRPLSSDMLSYASVDVSSLFLLFDHFKPDEEEMKRLLYASERYASLQRSKQTRNYDQYERNQYLPIDILPKKGSTYVETGFTQCTTCKRYFPRDEFSKNQLKLKTQKCRTCKKVKNDADVKANREANWERQDDRYDYYYDSDDYNNWGSRQEDDIDDYYNDFDYNDDDW